MADDEVPEEQDPYLQQVLDETLAAYEGVVPPEMLRKMRLFLGDVLSTHPVGATLLDRARPRAVPYRSGDQAKDGAEPAAKKKAEGSS
jgi:hypothetical protein